MNINFITFTRRGSSLRVGDLLTWWSLSWHGYSKDWYPRRVPRDRPLMLPGEQWAMKPGTWARSSARWRFLLQVSGTGASSTIGRCFSSTSLFLWEQPCLVSIFSASGRLLLLERSSWLPSGRVPSWAAFHLWSSWQFVLCGPFEWCCCCLMKILYCFSFSFFPAINPQESFTSAIFLLIGLLEILPPP